jgi:hypothetical protein
MEPISAEISALSLLAKVSSLVQRRSRRRFIVISLCDGVCKSKKLFWFC